MNATTNALVLAAALRAFCDSFEEAEQVMVYLRGRELPHDWQGAWMDIQSALLEIRKDRR